MPLPRSFSAGCSRANRFPALSATIAAIYGVIEATVHSPGGELALVAAQDEFLSPSRSVSLQKL
jgi:hypothetical protein